MKYTSVIVAGCALCLTTTAFAQTKKAPAKKAPVKTATKTATKTLATGGFQDLGDGLQYKNVVKGAGLAGKAGDIAEMHVKFKMGDSVLMNTFVANQGKPIQQPLQAPGIKGDVMGGLLQMKPGDSTVFRMLADTMFARSKQPKQEWVKSGTYVYWEVKLLSLKTQEQVQAERANMGKEQAATDDKLIAEMLKTKGITNAKKTASGLYYVIHKEGTGEHPKAGQKVTVNYTGVNMQGETFDSNVDPAFNHVSPFTFDLGKRNVIAGWDEGVALMKKDSKITLYIPSGMAYGPQARGPKIPANAILIFDIELTSFE